MVFKSNVDFFSAICFIDPFLHRKKPFQWPKVISEAIYDSLSDVPESRV